MQLNNQFVTIGRTIIITVMFLAVLVTASCAKPSATQVAEGMVDAMSQGDFSYATKDFDEAMNAAMPAERLGQTWSQLTEQVGAFKSRIGSREAQEAGYQMVYVTCQFEKANLDMKVVISASGQVTGLWIVPAKSAEVPYKMPSYVQKTQFEERPVFVNKGDEWQLPGTLTVPKGKGPFSAVVLVHGSGPEDRDETIGPNKPFKDIAWGLASRGIAVLRYDKRSKVYGPKMAKMDWNGSFTVNDETIDDALAAVELLRHSQQIAPDKIFVLGHSLGGILIPRIGNADPKIAGLIMMAGCATRPLEDELSRQLMYIASLNGPISDDTKREIDKQKQLLLKSVPASYLLDLRSYIPISAEMAKSLKQPMLIMQGGRDYQATEADFNIWKSALSSKTDVTFKLYPDLNHLFMTGTGKATPAEYEKPGTMAQSVIIDISDWIKRHLESGHGK